MLTFLPQTVHYVLFIDPQIPLFSNFFIKNGSHSTIYTFKNYFATVISAISFHFQQNKSYPNRPLIVVIDLQQFYIETPIKSLMLVLETLLDYRIQRHTRNTTISFFCRRRLRFQKENLMKLSKVRVFFFFPPPYLNRSLMGLLDKLSYSN